jgi:energy-converting hydrogenase A subunit R
LTLSLFFTDCEGPLTTNDNAFELASTFIPQGDHIFTTLSRYDDVLADIIKTPNYQAGSTLKFIAPFLKAYNVSNQMIHTYSSNHLILIQGTKPMLAFTQQLLPSYIVSTSYQQYLQSLCTSIGFDSTHVFATTLDLDAFSIPLKEVKQLQQLRAEIAAFPLIEIPEHAESIDDFSPLTQRMIHRLNHIFRIQLPLMICGQLLQSITPIGGIEKAQKVKAVTSQLKSQLANVMYVGDSITDAQALRLIHEHGGLSVAFNGNRYALEQANLAIIAENNFILAVIAFLFCQHGTSYVLNLVQENRLTNLDRTDLESTLLTDYRRNYASHEPIIAVPSPNNFFFLSKESTEYRRRVRGEAIGQLG